MTSEWITIREQPVRHSPPYRDWWVVVIQRWETLPRTRRRPLRVGAFAKLNPAITVSWIDATSMRDANLKVRGLCETLGGYRWNDRWVIDAPGMDFPQIVRPDGQNFGGYEQVPFYGPVLPGINTFMIHEPRHEHP